MAIIKCKMCGGDLDILPGSTVAECEYCGSRQTVPTVDNDKKLTLFSRANRLRTGCEFDKAAGIYESIVADFPEEAEAYWGLVLCKFGIEYVDDPATRKKIPTCHRSSFDSVMEDSDFEQALENADMIARKVYRDEAKQIEDIRRGIIAVSANEEPYDIFICYKETDEKGDRTLDSVLAQDIYDSLRDKGYRVFFARITLEDKLGMEYEPYIFAALNSAKIMLAVGTDYEYYNAVWVKNEWSRYLKLMARDKAKHLIPCYKGIDAYDMPKEFARLQAQDLGKVGAMQDLLRGIEKILPRQQKNTTVIQEKIVVGGGSNQIAALLDRGNMALEDGDWAKADSFFEDVLNNDSKNAQAYLGKTLAQEKCRNIEAFVCKRKDASQYVRGQTMQIEPDQAQIAKAVASYTLPGFVEEEQIRKVYSFDLSYPSEVAERKQQYCNEEAYWAEHKQLSRAEKFAAGAVAKNLAKEKGALFAALADQIKKAEAAEVAAKNDVQQRYAQHLRTADEKAAQLYEDGLQQREAYYQALILVAQQETDVKKLRDTAKAFDALDTYQDSPNFAEHCRKRAAEEQAILDAERKRLWELAEIERKKKDEQTKRFGIIAACILVAFVVFSVVLTTCIVPKNAYNDALELMQTGDYENAEAAFKALYKKYGENVISILDDEQLRTVLSYMESGDYYSAHILLIPEFAEEKYAEAAQLLEAKEYEKALAEFRALKGYKNSDGMIRVISGLRTLAENHEKAIVEILSGNVAVQVNYATNSPQGLNGEVFQSADAYKGLAVPENPGYRFVGWEVISFAYSAEGGVTVSLSAGWTDGYLIDYDLDGGEATNPTEYRKDGDDITLNNPTRLGYTFIGWTGTDLSEPTLDVTIPAGSYGNRTYTANWKPTQYTITLDASGGSVSNTSTTVEYGGVYTLPVPVRDFYAFLGWYCGDSQYQSGTWTGVEDIILIAKWQPATYSVTYHLSGGTNSTNNATSYSVESANLTLQAAEKTGYKFLGWYSDSSYKNQVTALSTSDPGNIELYAKWEIMTYTINYHLSGGTNAAGNADDFTIDSPKIVLKDPTRAGYKFLGWYADSGYKNKITDIPKGSYGQKELYAKWEAINYSITYNLNGGTNATKNPESFTIEDKVALQDPTRTGYKFLGWYSDSGFKTKVTQIDKGSQKNVSLHAKWEAITYTVSYDLNGGTISGTQVTSFTIEDLPLTLPTAKKAGVVFIHWGQGSASNGCVTQITELGNYKLVACFMDPGLRLGLSSDGKFYRVLGYSGTATHLEIPAYYQDLPVQEVDGDAFDNSSGADVHALKSIVLPSTIKVIEAYAFRDSDTLESVTFLEGLEEIEYAAFKDCDSLTSIVLPKTVKSISSEVFYSCDNLKEVHLSEGLTYLGERAFSWCEALQTVSLPDSLKTMSNWIFSGCISLKTATIPKAATTVPYGMYDGCTALERVTLHSGVTTIESSAFEGCTSLVSIIIPKSVTKIGSTSFAECTNITFYCEAEMTQSGWSSGWNNGNPVVYAYDPGSYVDPTYTFVTNGGTAVSSIKALKVETKPVSTKEEYALVGWYDNPECTGDPVSFPYYSTAKTTLYAKWLLASEYYNGTTMPRAYRLSLNKSVTIDFESSKQVIYYCFVPTTSGTYYISSSADTQLACYLQDAEGKSLTQDSTMYGGRLDMNYTLEAGQEYYLKLTPSCVGTWYDYTSSLIITR